MKLAFFLLLIYSHAWAKPVVLVTYFDAFGKATFNNSEKIALTLNDRFKDSPSFEFKTCSLSTVFDKSMAQFEDCLKELSVKPNLILGLGETGCHLKVETFARNLDKTMGPDNEGNERRNTPIIPEGPLAYAFQYPLKEMYCALEVKERSEIVVSNNAGTFVCNNYAYQVAHFYPEHTFGFIHVPSHNCKNLELKSESAMKSLEKMIKAALTVPEPGPLPMKKEELRLLRAKSPSNSCENEFYKRVRGIDEKGLWPF